MSEQTANTVIGEADDRVDTPETEEELVGATEDQALQILQSVRDTIREEGVSSNDIEGIHAVVNNTDVSVQPSPSMESFQPFLFTQARTGHNLSLGLEAVQSGVVQTIKNWLRKIWDFIKRMVKRVKDFFTSNKAVTEQGERFAETVQKADHLEDVIEKAFKADPRPFEPIKKKTDKYRSDDNALVSRVDGIVKAMVNKLPKKAIVDNFSSTLKTVMFFNSLSLSIEEAFVQIDLLDGDWANVATKAKAFGEKVQKLEQEVNKPGQAKVDIFSYCEDCQEVARLDILEKNEDTINDVIESVEKKLDKLGEDIKNLDAENETVERVRNNIAMLTRFLNDLNKLLGIQSEAIRVRTQTLKVIAELKTKLVQVYVSELPKMENQDRAAEASSEAKRVWNEIKNLLGK